MLIDIFNGSQIAYRYYKEIGRPYKTPKAARDQFKQDKRIDLNVLQQVIDEGYLVQCSVIAQEIKRKHDMGTSKRSGRKTMGIHFMEMPF